MRDEQRMRGKRRGEEQDGREKKPNCG